MLESSCTSTPIPIEIRRGVSFDFSETPSVHLRDNPYLSHFWNALSVMAPSTERILIRVAKRVRDRITDDRLRADLDALVVQEGLHTRWHRKLNARLEELGHDLSGVNAEMDQRLDAYVERAGTRAGVALMVAGEHLIYELCHLLVVDPRVTEGMDAEVKRLLLWHAAEEMEHQAVAHDVYVHLYGDRAIDRLARARAFVDATRLLVGSASEVLARLLGAGPAPSTAQRLESLRYFGWAPGYGRRVAVRSLRYFLPGFRPWSDRADEGLIRRTIAML